MLYIVESTNYRAELLTVEKNASSSCSESPNSSESERNQNAIRSAAITPVCDYECCSRNGSDCGSWSDHAQPIITRSANRELAESDWIRRLDPSTGSAEGCIMTSAWIIPMITGMIHLFKLLEVSYWPNLGLISYGLHLLGQYWRAHILKASTWFVKSNSWNTIHEIHVLVP